MPIIKSAQKRMRQTSKRRDLNIATKKQLRDSVRSLTAALSGKDSNAISESLRQAQSAIDTAVKKNLLHKNTAARRKSALAAKAKDAGATVKSAKPATKSTAKAAAPKTTKTAAKSAKPAAAKKPAAK